VTAVLDASAVLALIYREPGYDTVATLLGGAVISSVSLSEVIQQLIRRGHPSPAAAAEGIRQLGVTVLPFTTGTAIKAGLLWIQTRTAGLSLGCRACLVITADTPDAVAVTADPGWADLDLDIAVQVIT
jgi:ribonuclease VapC